MADFYVKRPVLSLAANERILTFLIAVQIAAPSTPRLDPQLILTRHCQSNEFILIITRAAAQTGPLRPVRSLHHGGT